MADKDKKSGLGEMLVFLAIAAVLMAVLYKLKTVVWNWATANRKRAWVCVPILLWPLIFVPVQIFGVISMSMTGLANFSEHGSGFSDRPTPDQEFVNGIVTWSDVVIAFVISLLITRRVVRKIHGETIPQSQKNLSFSEQVKSLLLKHQEKYQGRFLTKAELRQEFSTPPFYQNPKKWRKDNFDGGREYRDDEVWEEDENDPIIYKGPDLSDYGFNILSQKIKPLEPVEAQLILVSDLRNFMYHWNYALAKKLGLVESGKQSKPDPDDWAI
jgi:hypothetical protein